MAQPTTLPPTNGRATLDLTESQRVAIDALGTDERVIRAPNWLARQAVIPNDAIEREQAATDPDGFWRRVSLD